MVASAARQMPAPIGQTRRRPVRVGPGGSNLMVAGAWTLGGPSAGNEQTALAVSDGQLVKPDTSAPFDTQPPCDRRGWMLHRPSGGGTNLGILRPTGGGSIAAGPVTYVAFARADGQRTARIRIRVGDGGSNNGSFLTWIVEGNRGWYPLVYRGTVAAGAPYEPSLTHQATNASRIFIVPAALYEGHGPVGYIPAPGTTGPDEQLSVPVALSGATWTAAALLGVPGPYWDLTLGATVPLCTFYGDADNHVAVSYDAATHQIDAVVTSGGSEVGTIELAGVYLVGDDTIRLAIQQAGGDLSLTAIVHGNEVKSDSLASETLAVAPAEVRFGSPDWSSAASVDVYTVTAKRFAADLEALMETTNRLHRWPSEPPQRRAALATGMGFD